MARKDVQLGVSTGRYVYEEFLFVVREETIGCRNFYICASLVYRIQDMHKAPIITVVHDHFTTIYYKLGNTSPQWTVQIFKLYYLVKLNCKVSVCNLTVLRLFFFCRSLVGCLIRHDAFSAYYIDFQVVLPCKSLLRS